MTLQLMDSLGTKAYLHHSLWECVVGHANVIFPWAYSLQKKKAKNLIQEEENVPTEDYCCLFGFVFIKR